MAETRKHRPEVRDALDQALRDALGEPVRPAEPAEPAEPGTPPRPTASSFVVPGSALTGYTFGRSPSEGAASGEADTADS